MIVGKAVRRFQFSIENALRRWHGIMSVEAQQREVDRNYEAFKAVLPELLKTDENRFALLHEGQVIACFDTSRDAMQAGRTLLDGKHFSVQEVTQRTVDLGYLSYASNFRTV
ncbi:MAG: hypothetical protein OXF89_07970 [Rhodospirillaceae bacterium]|nr:hypothetical protein [Rhodospirillaceae bacterium]